MVSRLKRGCPRQLRVIWQNKRCSILFHLLVPGGKWQTLTFKPVSSANRCKATFHKRDLAPLLPPLSTIINRRAALGNRFLPIVPPPMTNRSDSEFSGVVVDANADGGFQTQSQPLGGVFSKKTSPGVRNPRHARGRLLSRFSTCRTWEWETSRKSVPLGKYWRIKPLVFSFVPR